MYIQYILNLTHFLIHVDRIIGSYGVIGYLDQRFVGRFAFVDEESDSDIDIVFGTGELKGPLHVDTYRVGELSCLSLGLRRFGGSVGPVFGRSKVKKNS